MWVMVPHYLGHQYSVREIPADVFRWPAKRDGGQPVKNSLSFFLADGRRFHLLYLTIRSINIKNTAITTQVSNCYRLRTPNFPPTPPILKTIPHNSPTPTSSLISPRTRFQCPNFYAPNTHQNHRDCSLECMQVVHSKLGHLLPSKLFYSSFLNVDFQNFLPHFAIQYSKRRGGALNCMADCLSL